jgi:putative aminopeptidase FrvX
VHGIKAVHFSIIQIGKGTGIKVLDFSLIAHPAIRERLIATKETLKTIYSLN